MSNIEASELLVRRVRPDGTFGRTTHVRKLGEGKGPYTEARTLKLGSDGYVHISPVTGESGDQQVQVVAQGPIDISATYPLALDVVKEEPYSALTVSTKDRPFSQGITIAIRQPGSNGISQLQLQWN